MAHIHIPKGWEMPESDVTPESVFMNRREFLTYTWGAATGLLLLGSAVATFQFMYPRFKAGEFGGVFEVGCDVAANAAHLCANADMAEELALIDIAPGVAEATALDLNHASGVTRSRARAIGRAGGSSSRGSPSTL